MYINPSIGACTCAADSNRSLRSFSKQSSDVSLDETMASAAAAPATLLALAACIMAHTHISNATRSSERKNERRPLAYLRLCTSRARIPTPTRTRNK
ncbi:unnamed protein product [Trichogramma brassicae]|uniref:Uncharacterized protein n=1 Tax=Trichogramma brassicae TaxID=86971 RepID=A0A6H5IB71_9HYME|nr:unnamed protein product [Trichogramma brassicae]